MYALICAIAITGFIYFTIQDKKEAKRAKQVKQHEESDGLSYYVKNDMKWVRS